MPESYDKIQSLQWAHHLPSLFCVVFCSRRIGKQKLVETWGKTIPTVTFSSDGEGQNENSRKVSRVDVDVTRTLNFVSSTFFLSIEHPQTIRIRTNWRKENERRNGNGKWRFGRNRTAETPFVVFCFHFCQRLTYHFSFSFQQTQSGTYIFGQHVSIFSLQVQHKLQ